MWVPIRLVEKTSSSARHTPLTTSLTPHERLRQGPLEDHVEVVAYDAKGCSVRALPDRAPGYHRTDGTTRGDQRRGGHR